MADVDVTTSAGHPKKASSDSGSVEQQSMADKIAADRYDKLRSAAINPFRALGFARIRPPGAL